MPPPQPQRDVNVHLPADLEFIEKGNSDGLHRCTSSYHGFGFRFAVTAGGYMVTEVARGYAADRAGLRAGDYIDNVHLPGESVVYVVRRDGATLRLPMKKETICQG